MLLNWLFAVDRDQFGRTIGNQAASARPGQFQAPTSPDTEIRTGIEVRGGLQTATSASIDGGASRPERPPDHACCS